MHARNALVIVPFIGLSLAAPAEAKTPLPPCPSDPQALWHNCTGTMKDDKGVQFSGAWRDDTLHGNGEVIWPDVGRYVGAFRQGLRNGRGTYYWPDGSRYVGEFRDDLQEGRGVLYAANGEVEQSGIWRAGEFIELQIPPSGSAGSVPAFGDTPVPSTGDVGSVPSFGDEVVPRTESRAPALTEEERSQDPGTTSPTLVESSSPAATTSCTPGPYIEPIDYASAEYIGNPSGKRARMCFYQSNGRDVKNLKFFPGGIFFMKSQTGAGGFAMGGAVLQSIRGTYGFDVGGRLNLRIAYSGTGVTQTVRGAGSSSSLDVSGRDILENEFTLPNCQKITLRNETRRYALGPALRSGRPDHLILEGERWELDSDCGDWEGWR